MLTFSFPDVASVVNRIVANLTGVAMAMIVAFIPPQVYGTDPRHVDALFRCERDAVSECLELLVGANEETALQIRVIHSRFVSGSYEKQKNALFLLKDASKMLRFPIFKVDPRLGQCLDSLSVLATAISNLLAFAVHLAMDETLMAADGEDRSGFLDDVKSLLRHSQEEPQTVSNSRDIEEQALKTEWDAFITQSQLIEKRLDHYAVELAEIHKSSWC